MAMDGALFVTLLATGLGAAGLLAVAAAATHRRRRAAYGLVTLAFAAIVLRTVVGGGFLFGHVDGAVHHLVEHLLDGVIIGLLLGAIYLTRRSPVDRPPDDPTSSERP